MNETTVKVKGVRFVGTDGRVMSPSAVESMSREDREAVLALVKARLGL